MKKLTFTILGVTLLGSCSPKPQPNIVTTSFVSYDLVSNIVGDTLIVDNIVPWGEEIHSFEPLARDIININKADLFVYTHPLLETWVKGLVENDNSFDMSAHYHEEHAEDTSATHDHGSLHFWTNPVSYLEIGDALLASINTIYPENAGEFSANYTNYKSSINASISELESFLETKENKTIYFAGHNALDAFSDHFGLTIRSLSESFKPDLDFTATALLEVINEMIANDVHYLFVEELAEPRAASVMKQEFKKRNHDITIYELHGFHNISAAQAKEDVTYGDLFSRNVTYIKEALGA